MELNPSTGNVMSVELIFLNLTNNQYCILTFGDVFNNNLFNSQGYIYIFMTVERHVDMLVFS